MRFLLDQDVYASTVRFPADLNHDVVSAAQVGLSQAKDEELLMVSQQQHRILVTRDRDFGALVFVNLLGSGVLYLRMLPSTQNAIHKELERVLTSYSEEELRKAFLVIEPDGHRIRRLPFSSNPN
jgi:predicted nuclease of predicted toxin-antitoxin system